MFERLWSWLFPPKCVLCRKILPPDETDLCRQCRKDLPEHIKSKRNIPFVAHWHAMWYYRGNVRESIHRYKFHNARHYADIYGRLLAMKLLADYPDGFDLLTWVPTAFLRKLSRGYDQSALLATAVGRELNLTPVRLLRKIRNTPPQSSLADASARRANVSGAYRSVQKDLFSGKRVLMLDDVVTTGATASECARILMTDGAKEVYLAAVAAAMHDKK